jgi:hypothetical protein
MAVRSLAPVQLPGRSALRQQCFDEHVPWHRIKNVVDITDDGGRLLAEVLEDFGALTALIIDLTGNPRGVRKGLVGAGDRVEVRPGDVLADLPIGAEYYLLPEGLDELDNGRLGRLMQSVARACLPSGRAMACVPTAAAARVVRAAERAGLEVTRQGAEEAASLIEFGSGPLRVLPNE